MPDPEKPIVSPDGPLARAWRKCFEHEEGPPRLILAFFMIHNMAMRIGDRMTAEIGLTSSRWMLLGALDQFDAPPTITELSRSALMSVQNASRMVASMEEEGLVERVSEPGGGRALSVRLTERGRETVETLRAMGGEFHERLYQGMSNEQIKGLAECLEAMIANLETLEADLTEQQHAQRTEEATA
jgi:DNA-binding MarR family transcriptional regulator